jgi:hypothetical protein
MLSSTIRKVDIWSNTSQNASLKAAAVSEGKKRSKKYLPREIRRSHLIGIGFNGVKSLQVIIII